MINIQGCHLTMNIITVNKVTFHLLSSQHAEGIHRPLQLNHLQRFAAQVMQHVCMAQPLSWSPIWQPK
jgi:hypothetical protein